MNIGLARIFGMGDDRTMKSTLRFLSVWVVVGSTLVACSSSGGGAEDAPLKINELMASNTQTLADENGEFDDYIELFNPTDQDVELGGYTVSDASDNPFRYELTNELVVPAGGVLLLWADGSTAQGPAHLPFKLSRSGESALISGPSGTLLDQVDFTNAPSDESYSRNPDGTGDWAWCATPTPGKLNGAACGAN